MLNIYDQKSWCVGRAELSEDGSTTNKSCSDGRGQKSCLTSPWFLSFWESRLCVLVEGICSSRSEANCVMCRRVITLLKTVLWLKPLRTTWWFTRLRFSRCDFFFFFKFTSVQTLCWGYWTICACVRGEHLADCSYSTTGRYNKDRLHQGKR